MKKNLQRIIQVAFLVIFLILVVMGKPQIWMGLFLIGIIASFFLGRIYCGWFCSINTVLKGVTWFKKKLHIKNRKLPTLLTKPWVRFLVLGLFIIMFIFTMVSGKKLPVLPILFTTGIILTFFFHEELWHRYLCPYGSILYLPGSKSAHNIYIDPEKCTNCGACRKVCPSKAIEKQEKNHEIIKGECLVCTECITTCKQQAISYK
ncbi:MAG: 4Fe-4S dicluster domain-containing protein [Firmicutes bacterium]|nr:4Fe-4S dicluster domain-containing protein [Bacillota bacterium]